MLQRTQISMEKGNITVEFYSDNSAEYRKYMFTEKLIITDCRLVSKNIMHRYEVSFVPVHGIDNYVRLLHKSLYNYLS